MFFFILSAQYIIPNLHFKGQLISLFLLLPSQMSASFKHDKHTNTIKQSTYQNQLISLPLSLPPLSVHRQTTVDYTTHLCFTKYKNPTSPSANIYIIQDCSFNEC